MEKTTTWLLIIFYRNPQLGKVKTRLAATVGDFRAIEIFRKLSAHVKDITKDLKVDKLVFYSDAIERDDQWIDATYLKALQHGKDLGERMENAFEHGFERGYSNICIIGTDCYELTSALINEAFDALNANDVVIGPARDGGYYLLGMKKLHRELFRNKRWSTETVFADTVADFNVMGLRYATLQTLRDVDTAADLPDILKE